MGGGRIASFLVDSVSAALERRGEHVARLVHPIIGISREDGQIASVSHARNAIHRESVMHFDLARKLTDRELEELEPPTSRPCCSRSAARSPTSAR